MEKPLSPLTLSNLPSPLFLELRGRPAGRPYKLPAIFSPDILQITPEVKNFK